MEEPAVDIVCGLIDLSDHDLTGLDAVDHETLSTAVQRIRDEIEHSRDAVGSQ